jgi:hypothetical protein
MKTAFGLNIPQTLEDVCDPRRTALLVYGMQVDFESDQKFQANHEQSPRSPDRCT